MEGKYISLITYTKKGDPIATPVWFIENDKKTYVVTVEKRYKLKRIRNNPEVRIAQSTFRGKAQGEHLNGVARILSDEDSKPVREIFKKKYSFYKLFFKDKKEGAKKPIYIEILLK